MTLPDWDYKAILTYAVAIGLPAAGIALTLLRLIERENDEALRLALCTVAGLFLYAAIFL